MKYFIKSLLLLSCFFLAIGCEFENYFKSKKLPKELGDGLEFTVKLTGPGSAYIDACSTAITVVRVDNDDNPISLPEAVTTSLNPQSGTFHTTSDCSDTAITSVTSAANESSEVIYWKGDELGTYLLSGSKIAEGLSIEVLPSIPAFSFAKDVFTMTDGGNSIAEEVTIVRPGVGTSQSVTFEIII